VFKALALRWYSKNIPSATIPTPNIAPSASPATAPELNPFSGEGTEGVDVVDCVSVAVARAGLWKGRRDVDCDERSEVRRLDVELLGPVLVLDGTLVLVLDVSGAAVAGRGGVGRGTVVAGRGDVGRSEGYTQSA